MAEKKQSVANLSALPVGERGRIYLIDSMSFIFRAYHAMARQRPMSTREGLPTGAVFVFVNMLNKLRSEFAPEHLAAVFDLPGKTERARQAEAMPPLKKLDKESGETIEIAYEGYKANRAEMPEDLARQIPYIRRVLEAFRIPILAVEGWEADDVIGTLAREAVEHGYAACVVSSDKDMMQLVGEKTCVLNPPKDNLICDPRKVEELLGVPPERVVDVMALRGDAIDNVPGAPGIGDKGSVELIQNFGSLDALLERAAEVTRKSYRESLLENRERILLSRELVTINRHVDIAFDPEAMRVQPPDIELANQLFRELEFHSMLLAAERQMESFDAANIVAAHEAQELDALLATLQKDQPLAIAAALEKTEEQPAASDPAQMMLGAHAPEEPALLLAFSADGTKVLRVAVGADESQAAARAREILADAAVAKAVHGWKETMPLLAAHGIELNGVACETQLLAYLLDPTRSSYSLEESARLKLNCACGGEVCEAAALTARLAATLPQEVEAAGLGRIYREIDLPLVPVLARMESAGVRIDRAVLAELAQRLGAESERLSARVQELAGCEFNVNSPKQLSEILFDKLQLPRPFRSGKGKTVSTAQDVLEQLAEHHEIAQLVLDYRQLTKLKSTYIDTLPLLADAGDRVHTTLQQTATATGRLSSVNPNLQNIPVRTELGREIRAAFVAAPGHLLLAADYSQIELRLLAHYSEDPLLCEAYRTGQDIHALTAAEVFGVPPMLIDAEHRRRAKAVNFGIVYGLSPFGLAQQLSIPMKEAKHFIDAYFERYAGVKVFQEKTIEQARADGFVRNLFGRVRPIPELASRNPNLRGFAERTAVNTPLQGTAADLIKVAMIEIDAELRRRGLQTRMLLQVHDELLFEAPEPEVEEVRALATEQMEKAVKLRVPLEVNVGVAANWRDAK